MSLNKLIRYFVTNRQDLRLKVFFLIIGRWLGEVNSITPEFVAALTWLTGYVFLVVVDLIKFSTAVAILLRFFLYSLTSECLCPLTSVLLPENEI